MLSFSRKNHKYIYIIICISVSYITSTRFWGSEKPNCNNCNCNRFGLFNSQFSIFNSQPIRPPRAMQISLYKPKAYRSTLKSASTFRGLKFSRYVPSSRRVMVMYLPT